MEGTDSLTNYSRILTLALKVMVFALETRIPRDEFERIIWAIGTGVTTDCRDGSGSFDEERLLNLRSAGSEEGISIT